MDTKELYERGLELREAMFGKADVEKRMQASGDFGAPLQAIINAYVYGDVWQRNGLSNEVRSLVMLGITAASNRPGVSCSRQGRARERLHQRSRSRTCCCWSRCIAASPPRSRPTASSPRSLATQSRTPSTVTRPGASSPTSWRSIPSLSSRDVEHRDGRFGGSDEVEEPPHPLELEVGMRKRLHPKGVRS